MITDEKSFRKKLKKELVRRGLYIFKAERMATGFPDELVSYPGYGNFIFELKATSSVDVKVHTRLFEPMQLHWLDKLYNAYGLVWVIGSGLIVYEVKSYRLEIQAEFQTVDELISWMAMG